MTNEVKVTENQIPTISINEYRTLVDQVNDLRNKNTELKVDKERLVEQLKQQQKTEANAEKVLVKTYRQGWNNNTETIEYRNLADVKAEAKELVETEIKDEIKALKDSVQNKEIEISELNHKLELAGNNYRRFREIEEDKLKDNYEKRFYEKEKLISELEKELSDTKKGKSEEQLNEAKASLIANLQIINEKLQEKFDKIANLPWWKRIFTPVNKISEFMTSIEAEVKDLFEAKHYIKNNNVNTIGRNYSSFNLKDNWY